MEGNPVDTRRARAHHPYVSFARIRLNACVVIGGAALLFSVVSVVTENGHPDWAGSLLWLGLVVVPIYLVAVWLVWQRPDHVQARRLLLVAASTAVGVAIEQIVRPRQQELVADGGLVWINLGYQIVGTISLIAAALLFATYPDGLVERPWQRVVVRTTWVLLAVPVLQLFTSPEVPIDGYLLDPIPSLPNPLAVPALSLFNPVLMLIASSYLGGIAAAIVLIVRYHDAAPAQRIRMRLLVYSIGLSIPVLVLSVILRAAGVPEDSEALSVIEALYIPFLLMIPVSIVVGVMRYGLYEIDVMVRRSLVYATLCVAIAVAYIALAVAPGIALGDQIPVQLAVVMTIVAALAFQPLRRRLEAIADRWVFGSAVNRYELLTDFGADLERTVELPDLLPRLADTVRRGLGAPWVRVSLPPAIVLSGEPTGQPGLSVALERGTRHFGTIDCGGKPEGFAAGDRELLATLAGQAATAVANVQLADELADRLDELEKSRARIVAAQNAERRRIERNIHDGVQQQVVALMMKIRLARNQVGRGERTAEAAFSDLQGDIKELLTDLRELAHGIHPPVLSDGGLIAAVEARVAKLPLDVRVSADPSMRAHRFDADVEGAAYFVICEALTNVAKHSAATGTEIAVWTLDDQLSVQVRDDGAGFTVNGGSGVGLTNLRDRVEALPWWRGGAGMPDHRWVR